MKIPVLINPWIHDFAAFDLWARPFGLYQIGNLLFKNGIPFYFFDLMNPNDPYYQENNIKIKRKGNGSGKFFRKIIETPDFLKGIVKDRPFSQYGLPDEEFLKRLKKVENPGVFLITSGMTYWYRGLFKVIDIVHGLFPETPIIVGGIYATLCGLHLKKNYEFVRVHHGEFNEAVFRDVLNLCGIKKEVEFSFENLFFVDYSWIKPSPPHGIIMTSKGCPYRCTHCASFLISGGFFEFDVLKIFDHLKQTEEVFGFKNYAVYDDALLVNKQKRFLKLLEMIVKKGLNINIHIHNGVHPALIDKNLAQLMFDAGVSTLRLAFETVNESLVREKMRNKIKKDRFFDTLKFLFDAGFKRENLGVYIVAGIPGQTVKEVEDTIIFLKQTGLKISINEYSPVPMTPDFYEELKLSKYDFNKEPLWQNNILMPYRNREFSKEKFDYLKRLARYDR